MNLSKAKAVIAVAVVIILAISGCSKTDLSIRFEMEKLLNNADRLQDLVKQKGQVFSTEDIARLVDAYSKVSSMITPPQNIIDVQTASQEKQQAWALSSLANSRIGSIYLSQKMYDKAYVCFKDVADNPATSRIQKNAILNYMALSLEKSKRFPEAAAMYDSVAKGYSELIIPTSPNMDGLDAPIKSSQMWLKAGDDTRYRAGMDKAREYFYQMVSTYKGTLIESAAIGKIAATYIEQKSFPLAIAALMSLPPDSSGHTSPRILLMIADICQNDLKDYSNAEKAYRDFLNFYPAHDHLAQAKLGIGLSLFEQGKFFESRQAVANIDNIVKVDQRTVAEAYYLEGLCYEKEDKWDLAHGQFDVVQATFTGLNEAFEAAIHITDHYRTSGQMDLALKAFESSINYFSKYIAQNAANPISCAKAIGYLVRAYTENGNMDQAAEQLVLLHDRYPQLPEGKLAPLRLADINENNLKDPAKAVIWLKTFVNENPDADNINDIKSHIEILEAHLKNMK